MRLFRDVERVGHQLSIRDDLAAINLIQLQLMTRHGAEGGISVLNAAEAANHYTLSSLLKSLLLPQSSHRVLLLQVSVDFIVLFKSLLLKNLVKESSSIKDEL